MPSQMVMAILADPSVKQTLDMTLAAFPEKMRKTQSAIVRKTSNFVARTVKKRLKKETTLDKETIGEAVKVQRIKGNPPEGTVDVSGKPEKLIDFDTVDIPPDGVIAKIWKDIAPLRLHHAFIREMPSGHVGVFVRAKHTPSKGPNAGKIDAAGKPLYRLTAAGFAGRLSIQERGGPSPKTLLQSHGDMSAIGTEGADFMRKESIAQIDKIGSGLDAEE